MITFCHRASFSGIGFVFSAPVQFLMTKNRLWAWEWENVKRETFAQLSRKLSINAMQVEQNRALLFGCNEMLFVPYLADDKNILE